MIYILWEGEDSPIEAVYDGPDEGDFSMSAWERSLGVPDEKSYCRLHATPEDIAHGKAWSEWNALRLQILGPYSGWAAAYRCWLETSGLVRRDWKML